MPLGPLEKTERRVLMVITSLGFGGADTQLVKITSHLRANGWQVAVASLVKPVAHEDTLAAIGVPVHWLGMTRGVPDPRAILRLARLVREWKPDVVHSHMVHANLLSRAARLIVSMPALVCTAHNTRETSERGGPTWHKELLYRLSDRLADCTTIICHAGSRHYIQTRAVPAERLRVIPIGVDCKEFAANPELRVLTRRELGLRDDEFVWLAVGRLVVQKDYPNLLRALVPLRGQNWKLLIAGQGQLREDLERLCRELQVAGQVRFLGVRQDIRAWQNAADAFVMSSELEGLPAALLEAAATGLPCVVTDVGGTSEVVHDGINGLVVPPKDPNALSNALREMMALPVEERREFASAARSLCVTEFEIGSVVARWEALYAQCLAGTATAARDASQELAPAVVPRGSTS